MGFRRLTALAGSMVLVGLAKAAHTNATADPFAAFWCRPSVDLAGSASWLPLQGHCWGCPLALIGAYLAIFGIIGMARQRKLTPDAGNAA